jgi:hypothetical protein
MASPRHLLSLVIALTTIPAGARTYCCTDEHGRRVCGDILPEQCQKRSYNEYNSQGVLSKQYPGPLTPEQRAQLDAELARKKVADHDAAEQTRRDRALLASYSSVADIDAKRTRTITTAQANLHNAEERLSNAQERQQRLQRAAERYGSKPMPEVLRTNLRISEAELSSAQTAVADHKKEIVESQKQFDEDRRRYLELTHKPQEDTPATPAVR